MMVSAILLASCGRITFYSHLVGDANCNSNPTIAREWLSPDGKHKVVDSRFDCPGWYAGKLEITNPTNGTKALVLDYRPSEQVRPAKWPEMKVEWKSTNEVWVTYPARQDTTCINKAGDVAVHCLDGSIMGSEKSRTQPGT